MKPVTEPILLAAANAFDFGGPVVCDGRHYGEGHINDTFWSGVPTTPSGSSCSASTPTPSRTRWA